MFERYTERARRVIFFARYEASQLGSSSIETEHLLLGLIREGKGLTSRLFSKSHLSMESIRKEIEGRALYRDKVSTSVDIPLSPESKRVLGFAAEEAERMLHNYIGTEHILLGLLREEKSLAAGILAEKGMRLSAVREEIVQLLNEKANVGKTKETPLLSEFSRDLTEAAARGTLDPLVGRDDELSPRHPGAVPPHAEQPRADRRAGRRQDRAGRGPRQQDRPGRRAGLPDREAHPGARHLPDRGRHQVPRAVRGAAQDDHA